MTNGDNWQDVTQRHGRQRGAMASILLTRGHFTIVSSGDNTFGTAAQISRNLFQYYAADSVILKKQVQRPSLLQEEMGNLITVAVGAELSPSELSTYPIRVEAGQLILRQDNEEDARQYHFEEGLGAIFLRPLEKQRLELVVWGADETGLQQAARLVPTLTGSGQPDFVITSRSCMWNGLGGAYAVGFLDSSWNVSGGSYIR